LKPYLETLKRVLETGHAHEDRTGVGRISIFGVQTRYDLSDGTIPLVTTRKIYTPALIKELLWFISGSYNNKILKDQGVNIWNHWEVKPEHIDKLMADIEAEVQDEVALTDLRSELEKRFLNKIGPMYGAMWRNAPNSPTQPNWPVRSLQDIPSDKLDLYRVEYEHNKKLYKTENRPEDDFIQYCNYRYNQTVDQLGILVENLKKRPFSSRLLVTALVPAFVPFEGISPQENVIAGKGALMACHAMFQCFVTPPKEEGGKKRLSLLMTQRSTDVPIGMPYNVAQYSVLLALLAHVTDMEPYEFIHDSGDTHVYFNQVEGVKEQLTRKPYPAPKLWINPEVKDLFKITADDIRIEGYEHHSHIKYPVAV
jgi:thymidylate synthase